MSTAKQVMEERVVYIETHGDEILGSIQVNGIVYSKTGKVSLHKDMREAVIMGIKGRADKELHGDDIYKWGGYYKVVDVV